MGFVGIWGMRSGGRVVGGGRMWLLTFSGVLSMTVIIFGCLMHSGGGGSCCMSVSDWQRDGGKGLGGREGFGVQESRSLQRNYRVRCRGLLLVVGVW